MVYQYYVVEIQQYANGEYGHLVHFAYDENDNTARLKCESKFYEVLAAAAVSELPKHSAIMFDSSGVPQMHKCYVHVKDEPAAEVEAEE